MLIEGALSEILNQTLRGRYIVQNKTQQFLLYFGKKFLQHELIQFDVRVRRSTQQEGRHCFKRMVMIKLLLTQVTTESSQ